MSIVINNKQLSIPVIQGGMGIGVSLSNLAGAVAKEGGMGVISCANPGFDHEDFYSDYKECNYRAIEEHITKAKEIANGNGLVGVNIMVAMKDYEGLVKAACESKADAIISGAGLPVSLPELVKDYDIAIAPIVSSEKSVKVILKMWHKHYSKTADFVVIEGPLAGGHLGFSKDEIDNYNKESYYEEIKKIVNIVNEYQEEYNKDIPVFVGGGVYSNDDFKEILACGAKGVQIGTRFVTTVECDASEEYKNAYLNAKESDIEIVVSPVGLPGRAVRNKFIQDVKAGNCKITNCLGCIKTCNPATAPYCITKALINAAKGNLDEGLIFCGHNAYKTDKIMSVKEVIEEIIG